MSAKINVGVIVRGHFSTLRDASTGKTSSSDIVTFYVLPAIVCMLGVYFSLDLREKIVEVVVTASAVLTGLLLNLLVLVYDQKIRLPAVVVENSGWQKTQATHTLLAELYFNISYAILVSLLVLVVALLHLGISDAKRKIVIDRLSIAWELDYSAVVTSPLLVFLGVNLLLTVCMVLKRIYNLLQSGA